MSVIQCDKNVRTSDDTLAVYFADGYLSMQFAINVKHSHMTRADWSCPPAFLPEAAL